MKQDFNSKLLKYCIYATITKRKLGNLDFLSRRKHEQHRRKLLYRAAGFIR